MLPRGRLSQVLATASRTLLTLGATETSAASSRVAAALSATTTTTSGTSSTGAGLACVGPHWQWVTPQHKHTTRAASSSAADAAGSEEQEEEERVLLTDAAVQRLRELVQEDSSKPVLRVSVSAGGCSGFQYQFDLVEGVDPDDRVFERGGVKVVADDVSYSFIKGSKIHFEEDLIRSAFVIADNPLAESSCGCGSSFAAKM